MTGSSLNNSLDEGDKARALHRVVRAIHDGNCPKCGYLGTSESFYVSARLPGGVDLYRCPNNIHSGCCSCSAMEGGLHRCPECGFEIDDETASAAMEEFRPFMEKNLKVFEEWRESRKASP